ncbi:MAG: 23S rRNA (adenine(2503)-C(2))-methyltransferase RlmN [Phycisphaerales bacterium]|nr:23S rRNA (adenine(2503)-C(2))-methyltransferase RlmN [Planctomycetota bacterium]MBL6997609.1 23S rRNA (adenine(2503)-C(2))-methyltransferase RlmN [Phycisphaerales bacterium]
MTSKTHALELFPRDVEAIVADLGMPEYACKQILNWTYDKNVESVDQMSNIRKEYREQLEQRLYFRDSNVVTTKHASDGTKKILLAWDEENKQTECVMIPSKSRCTACVSSQVGCPVGCTFCASGLDGLEGNLEVGQIVEQVIRLGADQITNIVFMGMGEPLANYDAVTRAIRILNAPWGLGIGARKITVSTVGLPTAIERLTKFDLPVTLALSLHAPTDTLRKQLIPWAKFASIEDILKSCSTYFDATGREITIEYLLLGGVNDRSAQAKELADLCKTLRCNVNLIRYNEVPGLDFKRPENAQVRRFQETLEKGGVNSHIRASRGRDISAACGQLRREQQHITLEESS